MHNNWTTTTLGFGSLYIQSVVSFLCSSMCHRPPTPGVDNNNSQYIRAREQPNNAQYSDGQLPHYKQHPSNKCYYLHACHLLFFHSWWRIFSSSSRIRNGSLFYSFQLSASLVLLHGRRRRDYVMISHTRFRHQVKPCGSTFSYPETRADQEWKWNNDFLIKWITVKVVDDYRPRRPSLTH